MAGLLDDDDLTPDAPPSALPPLPDDVAEEQEDEPEEVITIEDPEEDEGPPSPAQTAREQLQGTMGALLERLRQDAEADTFDAEEEAATLRRLEGRARIAKQLAEAHRDILALQSIPDPDRADRDRKGSLSRLAAALRHAHGAPVTTRPPGEE